MSLVHARFGALFAVLVFALCTAVVVDPIRMTNVILRRDVAQPGDLTFTLAYRAFGLLGALVSFFILVEDLWQLAHRR